MNTNTYISSKKSSSIYRKFYYLYNGERCTSVLYTSRRDSAAWKHLRDANYFEGIFVPLRIENLA